MTLSGAATLDVPAVVAFLVGQGVGIEQVTKQQDSLEDLYVRIEAEAGVAGGDRPGPQGSAGKRRRKGRAGGEEAGGV